MAQLKLNSTLDKWAQNLKKPQTNIVNSEKDILELLRSSGTDVTNLTFSKDEMAWVSWKYSEDNVATGMNVNVAVAAYVTTPRSA